MATMSRIDIRVDEEKKAVVAQAAKMAGLTITQYVMGLIMPDAERRLAEHYRITLSAADWAAFTGRLDAAPSDLSTLESLLRRKSRFTRG